MTHDLVSPDVDHLHPLGMPDVSLQPFELVLSSDVILQCILSSSLLHSVSFTLGVNRTTILG